MELDFRTKFITTFTVATLLISGNQKGNSVLLYFMVGLIPFLLFFIKKEYKIAIVNGGLYVAIFWLEELVVGTTDSMINFIILAISAIFIRLYPGVMMGYYTMKTTKMVDLIKSLKNAKVPDYITIPISVMFRFFFSLSHDYGEIKKAKKLQGIGVKEIFTKPIKTLEYSIVPLSMCALRAADDVSISAMSRGLRPGLERSSISDAKLKYYDYIMFIIMITLFVIHIWSKYVRS